MNPQYLTRLMSRKTLGGGGRKGSGVVNTNFSSYLTLITQYFLSIGSVVHFFVYCIMHNVHLTIVMYISLYLHRVHYFIYVTF